MTKPDFEAIIFSRLKFCGATLQNKQEEYANDSFNDPLHNFKEAAMIDHTTTADALWGMFLKHFVSIADMVYKNRINSEVPSEYLVAEKITDAINYLILLECVFDEERKEILKERNE